MLLRSASVPNSLWMAAAKDASAAHDFRPIPRVRSVAHLQTCLSTSSSSFGSLPSASSSSSRRRLVSTISRALSEGDLWDPVARARGVFFLSVEEDPVGEADEDQIVGKSSCSGASSPSLSRLSSTSGLDESGMLVAGEVDGCCIPVGIDDDGCSGGRDGGGKMCGEGNYDAIDAYYLHMIEAYPENSLFLGNYAKFLMEVRGDTVKAQQYCEMAIVANPGDASVLALYADLVWQTSRDASRAEGYFDRAVKIDPDDCYIMASYAKFLWDTEEAEGATESSKHTSSPFLHGATSPIAAAS